MQVQSVENQKIDIKNNAQKVNTGVQIPVIKSIPAKDTVSFTGGFPAPNPVVGLMDFIAAGGFAASFIIQDGLGFVFPRVYKGLTRGGKKKKDENGNDILNKKGEPKRELNWAYARKEAIREVITGPSAVIIPYLMLKGITKRFGTANNVRLDYIDGFEKSFISVAQEDLAGLKDGRVNRKEFYQKVFTDVIEKSINDHLPAGEKMSAAEVAKKAEEFAIKQFNAEEILGNKSLDKKAKKEMLDRLGSVTDEFMKLKKQKIGGAVSEMAVELSSSSGAVKRGNIADLTKAMKNYFDDAVSSVSKTLKQEPKALVQDIVKTFTGKKLGSRFLTNIGAFFAVAAFYTQIPKLYNLGTKGVNPALANDEEEEQKPQIQNNSEVKGNKDVSFSGSAGLIEGIGKRVFNSKGIKKISDLFELHGPIIEGGAMATLLYGFCIPPRLRHAQDKYDYGEIVLRDMTAFTALLFGAKALARVMSDGFTKLTGLGLNKKDLEGKKWYQKAGAYLHPGDGAHSVLSSHQLDSKYTHLKDYKGQVNGFMEFIEQSGGDVKKAFSHDKKVRAVIDQILQEKGKTFASSTSAEIKEVLKEANLKDVTTSTGKLMEKFYKLFEGQNGLLKKAKTCNSAFGFVSTLLLVPGMIIALTDMCKKMTDKRKAQEKEEKRAALEEIAKQIPVIPSNKPTMAGFLNK